MESSKTIDSDHITEKMPSIFLASLLANGDDECADGEEMHHRTLQHERNDGQAASDGGEVNNMGFTYHRSNDEVHLIDDIEAEDDHYQIDADEGRYFPDLDGATDSGRYFASSRSFSSFDMPELSSKGQMHPENDLIHLISVISCIYRRNAYLKMMSLDANKDGWTALDRGSTFTVETSAFNLPVKSLSLSQPHRVVDRVSNVLAIKRVPHKGLIQPSQIRSFICELLVLDHLLENPFIVDLRGVGWFNEFHAGKPAPRPAILLEEASGSLETLVGSEWTASNDDFETLFGIYAQVSAGLVALHQIRAVHGDIKPGNVLLFIVPDVRDGVARHTYFVKLSDFGSSCLFGSDSDQTTTLLGTKGYMAPEVVDSVSTGRLFTSTEAQKTDIWSLGVLFAVLWSKEISQNLISSLSSGDHARRNWIISQITIKLENSSSPPELARVCKVIFNNTLILKPEGRHLTAVHDALVSYLPLPLKQRYELLQV